VYTDEQIRQAILRKMLRQAFIGGKHTSIENLPKGLPNDKKTKKRADKIINELIKQGFFIVKPKPDALHVSLDPKMLPKVKDEIQKNADI
jgi:hypothetical protein